MDRYKLAGYQKDNEHLLELVDGLSDKAKTLKAFRSGPLNKEEKKAISSLTSKLGKLVKRVGVVIYSDYNEAAYAGIFKEIEEYQNEWDGCISTVTLKED